MNSSELTVHGLKINRCVAFLIFIFSLFPVFLSWAFCQPVTSTELIKNPKTHNNKIISYEGEVIGDIMKRGKFSWVNIKDADNAIGCWVPNDLMQAIVYTGNYKSKGDLVEVTGLFRNSCLEHGGDLDIHVESLRKLTQGRLISEHLNPGKRNLIFVLLGVLCLVLILMKLKGN